MVRVAKIWFGPEIKRGVGFSPRFPGFSNQNSRVWLWWYHFSRSGSCAKKVEFFSQVSGFRAPITKWWWPCSSSQLLSRYFAASKGKIFAWIMLKSLVVVVCYFSMKILLSFWFGKSLNSFLQKSKDFRNGVLRFLNTSYVAANAKDSDIRKKVHRFWFIHLKNWNMSH